MVRLAPPVISFIGVVGLSTCGLVPTSSGPEPWKSPASGKPQEFCFAISWRNPRLASDINDALLAQESDARLTKVGRRPSSAAMEARAADALDQMPGDPPLRSERSVALSREFPEQYAMAALNRWLSRQVAVERQDCPRQSRATATR